MSRKKTKKVLIISCTGGSGHIRAAEAIKKTCEEFYETIECKHINLVDFSGWLLKLSMVHSYNFLVKHRPKIFRKIYYYTDANAGDKSLKKTMPLLKISGKKILKEVEDFNPDRIICTHFLPPILLEKAQISCPVDVVVTDFYAHQSWSIPSVRALFVGAEDTKEHLSKNKIPIIVSGIPIDPIFYKNKNISELKQKFRLLHNSKTILVLSGGVSLIDMSQEVGEILKNFSDQRLNIIVISGKNNQKAYEKLCALHFYNHNYKILEFTTEIDEYMRIADVVITKPGGLTLSECLFLQKPLILINPIPGQEEKNAEYIIKHKFGYLAQNINELLKQLEKILNKKNAPSLVQSEKKSAAKIILDYDN